MKITKNEQEMTRKDKAIYLRILLTYEDKQENTVIGSFRVIAEHAICGIKRFNCLNHIYRNKIDNLDDKFILICSGLWNWHLRMS